jgi:hypothetical protein
VSASGAKDLFGPLVLKVLDCCRIAAVDKYPGDQSKACWALLTAITSDESHITALERPQMYLPLAAYRFEAGFYCTSSANS